jgi:LPXTG-motif cell wall-anchored protein
MKYSALALLIGILLVMPTALSETTGVSGVLVSSTTENVDAPEQGNIRLLQTKYEPYPAEPGQIVTLWVATQNWGQDSIDNVYLRVVPEYPFSIPQGTGIIEVGRVAAFGERLAEFDLIVNEDAIEGVYSFDVQQCSDNDCTQVVKELEVSISVKTGGSPRIRVGLEDSSTFWGGKSGDLTLNIVNRGKLDIKFLTITLLPSDDYEILSPSEIYIGELESDDFDTSDFKIFTKENIASKDTVYVDLPVKVEYTDSNNRDYTSQSQVKLKVYSQNDLKRYGLMIDSNGSNTYLIVLLIIAGAGFWYWRKKKNKHH